MTIEIAVQHRFGGFALDVEFIAGPGVTALFGRSGSGKSTIINAVAGLLRPDQGRIVAGGRVLFDRATGMDVAPHLRRVGYVFQDARLFPHLTVRQNLSYGRWFAKGAPAVDFDRVVQLLGLDLLLGRRPGALSGGEKQRVAIGRALLASPEIFLMDEPLAALDGARKAEIMPYLESLRDMTDCPILYVSHAVSEIARLANEVVLIEAGRVVKAGPVAQVLADPSAVAALGPRGAGSVLQTRIAAQEADGLTRLESSAGSLFLPRIARPLGTPVRLRIAAQDVILADHRPEGLSALNILPGVVTGLHLGEGPGALVQLRLGEDYLLARITQRSARALGLVPGKAVFAVLKSLSVAPDDIGLHRGDGD